MCGHKIQRWLPARRDKVGTHVYPVSQVIGNGDIDLFQAKKLKILADGLGELAATLARASQQRCLLPHHHPEGYNRGHVEVTPWLGESGWLA